MAGRRTLSFASLEEIMPDVDRLLEGDHATVGNWSLGQICNHLAGTFTASVDGVAFKAPWLVRKTIAPIFKKKLFQSGRMREGITIPEAALPKPGLDARGEAERLRAALQRYATHTGAVADHPFFGPLTRDEWTRIHCIHCAHHLSFALPGGA